VSKPISETETVLKLICETERQSCITQGFPFLGPSHQNHFRPSFSAHNSQIQAGVAISHDTPCSTWTRELARHCLVFFFSGPAQQLDWCRVSYDSKGVRWWRGCWVTCQDFFFLFWVGANVQVLHHILAMGRLPIEPSFSKEFKKVSVGHQE
jgi:hypothetical protein